MRRVGIAALFRGLVEEGDIEEIGLAGVDGGGLSPRDAVVNVRNAAV